MRILNVFLFYSRLCSTDCESGKYPSVSRTCWPLTFSSRRWNRMNSIFNVLMLAPQPSANEITGQANTTCASPQIVKYLPKIRPIKIVTFMFLGCYSSQALDPKSFSYYVAGKLILLEICSGIAPSTRPKTPTLALSERRFWPQTIHLSHR